ncbi:GRIP1-associated protein 1 isoform X2 [Melopsittacus undulatus]|uniref:GRIP1-associated protein 1 isoform X2 n=1 Tax=Melopsittacus undulatus TaxID=13146 RepID=UPI00146A6CF2|nr:GRIP1-associated protein 1 isoform X2 [Melopsittacus undulatus]
MAQALSAEEFQRMQEQLLQLRTENYRLSDELRKNGAELSALRQRVQALDRDLAKANKALSKSKKAQEVEALLGETRMLQGKLQSQEDDFRLQNSTLLRELAKLCAQIEGLEQENRRLQEGGAPGPPPDPTQDGAAGDSGAALAHTDAPLNPPKEPAPAEEGTGTDALPPEPQLMEKLRKQENSSLQLEAEKETLLRDQQLELKKLQAQKDEEFRELQTRIQRLQQELEAATKEEVGLREQSGALAQDLQEAQAQRDALDSQLQACAEERERLRQRLSEAEAAWGESERRRQQTQEQLERREQEQAAAEQQRLELEGRVGELRVALGDAERHRELQEAEGQALRQELKDVRDGQRILEKKGSAALKDLKRQLQLERRRADRLQERLQELLAPTRARSGLEELGLEGGSPGRGPGGDSSSLSSLGRDGSAPGSMKSGSGSPGGGSGAGGVPCGGGLSPAEVAELFQRLAQSQQERWLLEEKVRHLEVSSASMAEDLCRKSAIIQSFVRDSRLEAAGPSGLSRRGPGPGEEELREMNKKLQNLLEEQLTKNLHLGQDLEALSQELARLRKERAAPPGPP